MNGTGNSYFEYNKIHKDKKMHVFSYIWKLAIKF